MDCFQVVHRSAEEWSEYEDCQTHQDDQSKEETWNPIESKEETWNPIEDNRRHYPSDCVILIPAASVFPTKETTGYGIIAKDKTGKIVAVLALRDGRRLDRIIAEAEAIRLSLVKASSKGWKHIEISKSSSFVMQKIINKNTRDVKAAILLEDISVLSSLFSFCSFNLVSNNDTKVSYKLADFASDLKHDIEWEVNFPSWIS